MSKYIGEYDFKGDVVETSEIRKAEKALAAQGANQFQIRIGTKMGGWGDSHFIKVCGYKK
jgi:hypothetical protein